jgi:hypothetical protein
MCGRRCVSTLVQEQPVRNKVRIDQPHVKQQVNDEHEMITTMDALSRCNTSSVYIYCNVDSASSFSTMRTATSPCEMHLLSMHLQSTRHLYRSSPCDIRATQELMLNTNHPKTPHESRCKLGTLKRSRPSACRLPSCPVSSPPRRACL